MSKDLSNRIQKKIDEGAKTIGDVDVNQLNKAIKRKKDLLSNDKPVKK